MLVTSIGNDVRREQRGAVRGSSYDNLCIVHISRSAHQKSMSPLESQRLTSDEGSKVRYVAVLGATELRARRQRTDMRAEPVPAAGDTCMHPTTFPHPASDFPWTRE